MKAMIHKKSLKTHQPLLPRPMLLLHNFILSLTFFPLFIHLIPPTLFILISASYSPASSFVYFGLAPVPLFLWKSKVLVALYLCLLPLVLLPSPLSLSFCPLHSKSIKTFGTVQSLEQKVASVALPASFSQ